MGPRAGRGSPLHPPPSPSWNGNLGLFVQGIDDRLYVNWLLTDNQWTGWAIVPGQRVHPFNPRSHRPGMATSGSSCRASTTAFT